MESPIAGPNSGASSPSPAAACPLCTAELAEGLEPTPTKLTPLWRLLENKVLASPLRWNWILELASKLVMKKPEKLLDGKVWAQMKAQSDLLEDRAAAPQLRALKAHRLQHRRREVRMMQRIKQMHKAAARVTERVGREVSRVEALKARREAIASPQRPLNFARDNACRVMIG